MIEVRRRHEEAGFKFATAIDGTNVPDAARAELKQKLSDYQRDFFAWMETALTLAGELKATSEFVLGSPNR